MYVKGRCHYSKFGRHLQVEEGLSYNVRFIHGLVIYVVHLQFNPRTVASL